ncbi:TRAP-type C4-dicarboxylate transport system permease small subunit [Lipingzhangella halophila]|uniref:TRAP-type C4-dicarboxylate transport system permease small subunit n=1 Tax=Lipingzhangella halophila TaxID=1783352 RepID=A0A7W7W5H2_9ACTN|nr:TRAP transporter small permease [Lipingzhangella halophila]MBB4935232.1 TRAP-type C4-dicarboxylate transport system permease small subunit [Lipingzhangella halophila]
MMPKFQAVTGGVLRAVDRTTDTLALTGLAAMVVVVSWQVFGRFVLSDSPPWAPETALVLLPWLGLLGVAIGVREHAHIGVTFVADRLPRRARTAVRWLTPALFLVFGIYLVVQGWQLTLLTMNSTLPATGLPTAVQYAPMPVAGVLVCVYSALQLLNVETGRGALATPEDGEEGEEESEARDDR